MSAASAPGSGSLGQTFGWGAYLACSWTWCIGMFLPVLMLRDFGWWGFLVFAAPNCIGAAAMGWVISKRDSRRMVREHLPLLRLFSLVTIAYQCFFAGWFGTRVVREAENGEAWLIGALVVVIAAALLACVSLVRRGGSVDRLSGVVFVLSLSLLGGLLGWKVGGAGGGVGLGMAGISLADLPLLAPVVVFGFALCPYLDLTFHKARVAGSGPAFGIGFLVLFPLMILGTTVYAVEAGAAGSVSLLALIAVLVHIGMQLSFTTAVHTERLDAKGGAPRDRLVGIAAGAIVLGLIVTFVTAPKLFGGMSVGEVTYRTFLGCYGLLFPAYVWICAIPNSDNSEEAQKRKQRVWLFACGVAAPMFYLGFIEMREWFLVPGLLVVLGARLLIPGGAAVTRRAISEHSSSASARAHPKSR